MMIISKTSTNTEMRWKMHNLLHFSGYVVYTYSRFLKETILHEYILAPATQANLMRTIQLRYLKDTKKTTANTFLNIHYMISLII